MYAEFTSVHSYSLHAVVSPVVLSNLVVTDNNSDQYYVLSLLYIYNGGITTNWE